MHRFPESILVELEPDEDVPVEQLLVGLICRLGERDYVSALVGLIDRSAASPRCSISSCSVNNVLRTDH